MSGVDCTVGRRDCDGPGDYHCDDELWGSRCRAWQRRNGGYHAPDGVETDEPTPAERLAQAFHEAYELLAPTHGYSTRAALAAHPDSGGDVGRWLRIQTARDVLTAHHGGPA